MSPRALRRDLGPRPRPQYRTRFSDPATWHRSRPLPDRPHSARFHTPRGRDPGYRNSAARPRTGSGQGARTSGRAGCCCGWGPNPRRSQAPTMLGGRRSTLPDHSGHGASRTTGKAQAPRQTPEGPVAQAACRRRSHRLLPYRPWSARGAAGRPEGDWSPSGSEPPPVTTGRRATTSVATHIPVPPARIR